MSTVWVVRIFSSWRGYAATDRMRSTHMAPIIKTVGISLVADAIIAAVGGAELGACILAPGIIMAISMHHLRTVRTCLIFGPSVARPFASRLVSFPNNGAHAMRMQHSHRSGIARCCAMLRYTYNAVEHVIMSV